MACLEPHGQGRTTVAQACSMRSRRTSLSFGLLAASYDAEGLHQPLTTLAAGTRPGEARILRHSLEYVAACDWLRARPAFLRAAISIAASGSVASVGRSCKTPDGAGRVQQPNFPIITGWHQPDMTHGSRTKNPEEAYTSQWSTCSCICLTASRSREEGLEANHLCTLGVLYKCIFPTA